ncbi:sulfur carrier protein ThiS [compost metagenome]|jgi:sulfur carrier protein|uniref:Thiamine biosynthesis protein ThiS n=1 Tax=Sphingobacterium ginsenosidimutans TaxID=687845 RepID=A0ABP7ZSI2_9SPHI|nr:MULTISPECIES: sulfur carrier protein ThiS [unclassified Sphingobacterium]ULT24406.1 sulfur carrier protein ThiS [Sphingobacterium sp. E70]
MELTINHQIRFFDPAPGSLAELLQTELSGKTQGIAVALNNCVVPKDNWTATVLQPNDHILLITATQGG